LGPLAAGQARRRRAHFPAGMQVITLLPHIIVMGVPMAIIFIMDSQRSRSMSMLAPSIGITLQTMPSLPISMVIRHIIGIMPDMPGIIGIMPGMPDIIGIIPPIMGMPMPGIIMFIMGEPIPPIIGIMPMPIMGMPPIIGIIMGMPIEGIIIGFWDMGIAGMFMAGIMASPPSWSSRPRK
jgi:hypothetical protein